MEYPIEWFKRRAFESLKKIDDDTWDYSDSLLAYVPTGAEAYEDLQEDTTSYFHLVTKPEREYLQSIADEIADMLPDHFEYVDLGPGTEHKEQFFFDALVKKNKTFTYIPVDISDYFLSLAHKYASEQNIPTRPIQASFEELAEKLGETKNPRFVSLGLTFSNYDPDIIINLLKDIAGPNGFIFINAQMRDRTDLPELQKFYQEEAIPIFDAKIKLLDLDREKDITPYLADDCIKIWCKVAHPNEKLQEIGVKSNDSLLVLQTLRYTKESLEETLQATGSEYTLLDKDSSFIATVLRT